MRVQPDKYGLDRNPHNLVPDAWYYEERDGLHVYNNKGLVCIIPRRKLEASLKRINAARKKRRE